MIQFPSRLQNQLNKRSVENSFRELKLLGNMIDFCSNDYLGFSRSEELNGEISEHISQLTSKLNGATGSRLISGNSELVVGLEGKISSFFSSEAALLFNSGYNANQGVLSALPQRGDLIIYDELAHASIKDGMRLSHADKISFKHNDLEDLESKLQKPAVDIYVVVESIYSMDGDLCPLKRLVDICTKHGANLIVDEAHSVGVIGNEGKGLCVAEEVQDDVFARIYTFGKALGVHGASVVGSQKLIDFLINFSRPFIYTTALPEHSVISMSCAIDFLSRADIDRQNLTDNIAYFQSNMAKAKAEFRDQELDVVESYSAIQGVIISGNIKVKNTALMLQDNGLDVRPILSPTVKSGTERLRICLHSYNTFDEIDLLIQKIIDN